MNWTGGPRTKQQQTTRDQLKLRRHFDRQQRLLPIHHLYPAKDHDERSWTLDLTENQGQSQSSLHRSNVTRTLRSPKETLRLGKLHDTGYQTARRACIDMLHSSFDWQGEEYILRQPQKSTSCVPGPSRRTISDTSVDDDTDDSESDGDPCVVLTPFALSSAGTVESNREGTEQVGEGDKDDGEDDEEECLQIPARHIANCHAARALQLTVLKAKAKMLRTQAAKRPCAADAADKREHHDLSVGTSSQESQMPREDVSTTSSKQTGIELEDYLLSPIVSAATPVIRYSSLNSQSLDWPPANQEAARRLQWPDLNDRDHAEDLDTRIGAPSPRLYSPIHLPSDPEDTSILEALDVFNGESLIRSTFVQEVEWRPDSFSEWIGSDDWPTIDEADPSTDKSQGWGQGAGRRDEA
ncbi:hypothetical protein BGZ99_006416 [Dissophora globulifera]|uniref:Uncharacterized protein n=1 Tax=Dissophora globulifera TaxID=979702 RepID=A0A9P6USH3_9FUNG|nr:hypothetical protein BGZ99_006416 [Dissophora globulifera]